MKQNISKLRTCCYKLLNYFILKRKKVTFINQPSIEGILRLYGRGKISIGSCVKINSAYHSNPIGGMSFTTFTTIANGSIHIGNNVGISNTTIVSNGCIRIGNNVKIGGNTAIYDTDFHSLNYIDRKYKESDIAITKEVIIENDVFIGAHVIVLKGVTIGKGAVIGAGSVVSKSIPENEIWAGNPIRFIRRI